MRSAVGVRACFANVFATKLVINRQEGVDGDVKGKRGRGGSKRARGSGARSEPRFSIRRGAYDGRATVASESVRTRLGYREEKQVAFDTEP